jgi:hypothetical protein
LATRASALLRTARVFACLGRRTVVANAPRTRMFSRVTRRKTRFARDGCTLLSPPRQDTRPQRCRQPGENTCFPRPDAVSACYSHGVSRVKRVCDTVSQSGVELRHFAVPVPNACFPRLDAVSGCSPGRVCNTPLTRAHAGGVANGCAATFPQARGQARGAADRGVFRTGL